jgi:hypothetical protein
MHIIVKIHTFPLLFIHPQSLSLSKGKIMFIFLYPILNFLLRWMPPHLFPSSFPTRLSGPNNGTICWMRFDPRLCTSFLTLGILDPGFIQSCPTKKPRASTYQSSTKVEEGLTRDAKRITETIRSCDRDEG